MPGSLFDWFVLASLWYVFCVAFSLQGFYRITPQLLLGLRKLGNGRKAETNSFPDLLTSLLPLLFLPQG